MVTRDDERGYRAEQAAGLARGSLGTTTADDLPELLTSSPAAVLLIDLTERAVLYVSPRARELADVHLPVPVADWSAAAGLRDIAGSLLETTTNPLLSVAAGQPVRGHTLLAGPEDGRVLWATGFPFVSGPDDPLAADTPPDLHDRALLVLLDISSSDLPADAGEDAQREWDATLQRSMLALDLSVAVSDPRRPDNPLVWVNEVFTRTTGYAFSEAVGRNCRFLQGSATDPRAVQAIRDGLAQQRNQSVVLLNYRKDGTPFWNELSIAPVFDAAGALVSFVAVQADVTDRVTGERERESLLLSEQRARASSESANRRLRLAAEATRTLASSLALEEVLTRFAQLLVPDLLDAVAIDVADEQDTLRRVAVLHHRGDTHLLESLTPIGATYEPDPDSISALAWRTGEGQVIEPWPASASASRLTLTPKEGTAIAELDPAAVAVFPMVARDKVLGLVTAVATATTAGGRGRLDAETLGVLGELTTSAALAVENAQLYGLEHRNALILQRSLLPPDPVLPGVQIVTRYHPAGPGNEVGGDWYDAYTVADGNHALVVGDAVGHDLAAAAAMGRLRNVLQGCAFDAPDPAAALQQLERAVARPDIDGLPANLDMASAFMAYLRLDHTGADLVWSNAGHPPALLRTPDAITFLDADPDPMLGVATGITRHSHRTRIPSGSLLALFTDGLVEVRGEDISLGHTRLADLVRGIPADTDLNAVADHIIDSVAHPEDDVCLLLLRVP